MEKIERILPHLIITVIAATLIWLILAPRAQQVQSAYVRARFAEMASKAPQKKPKTTKPLKIEWALISVGVQCKESAAEWNCKPRTIRLGLQQGGTVLWK